MSRRPFVSGAVIVVAAGVLVGCQQPAANMEHQGPPPRPGELDRLNMFAGTWNGTAEITMYTPKGPQTSKFAGTERTDWALNNRFMVSNFEWSMGADASKKHTGIAYMTWDPKEKEYHSWEFMDDGTVNRGEMEYNEATKTWKMEGKGTDPINGGPSRSEGTMKLVDDKTMEWSFKMWDPMKLSKKMEGKGTSTKQ